MKKTKPSGFQYRKRKAERQAESQRSSESLIRFLQRPREEQTSDPGPLSCFSAEEPELEQSTDISETTPEEQIQSQEKISDTLFSPEHDSDSDSTCILTQEIQQDEQNQQTLVSSSLPYIDLADPANWPSNITSSFIDTVLEIGLQSQGLEKKDFPADDKGRHFSANYLIRKLPNGEELKRRWLLYSDKLNRVFCMCCKLFPDSKSSHPIPSQLGTTGHDDWKHLGDRLKEHETSRGHVLAYCKWTEAEIRLKMNKGIDALQDRKIKQEVEHWKCVLKGLMAITLYLAEHNQAFRGSSDKPFTPNNGNYLGLVELLGQFNDSMREHLRRCKEGSLPDHYLGKNIQNEIINLMAEEVLIDIKTRAKQSKYFSIILDCTPDVSHSEKLSVVIRFTDFSNPQITVKEHFLGFKEVSRATGKTLTDILLQTLSENGLEFTNLRGQGYDNGANMKAKHQGVQARVMRMNPRAFFLPCGCHSLNLVISDASNTTEAINLFGVLQRIYVFFSASVQRWQILLEHVPTLTIKPLCTTRWESRLDTVKAICTQTKEVYDGLMQIHDKMNSVAEAGAKHEAYCLSEALCDFKFLVGLCVWYDLLYQINIVSKFLQKTDCDIVAATEMLEGAISFLKNFREDGFQKSKSKAEEVAKSLGVDPVFLEKRRRKHKKMFEYETVDNLVETAEQKFRREFFIVTIDTAVNSLNERFKQMLGFNKLWGFLFNLKCLPENLEAHCMDLHHALSDQNSADINGAELAQELNHFKFVLPCSKNSVTPKDALQYLHEMEIQDNFPNIWIALRILLTIPITVASAERSFSKLKLIKTYLRSTMTDNRLSSLAVLSIENDIAHAIDLSKSVATFAQMKARKVPLS